MKCVFDLANYMRINQSLAILIIFLFLSGCFSSNSEVVDEDIIIDRFDHDIPLPSYPVCPLGSDCSKANVCSESHSQVGLQPVSKWMASGSSRMLSSPRVVDLDGDNVLDVVVGTGVEELTKGSIVAINGDSGEVMWESNTNDEMFSSAQFSDLTGDGFSDVILGGRGSQLSAINGVNGETIWEFNRNSSEREKWFQFYTGQFIEDQDGDGILDWLTSNGGDPKKAPTEERDGGYMMIISGKTGNVLGVANTPDNRETYMSPVLYRPHPDMELEVLFGTGGETWSGSLWVTSVSDILEGNISESRQIISPPENVTKGVMAPPAIADFNLDGIQDIATATFDGRIVVLDGRNYSTMWSVDIKDYALGGVESAESWATPAVGYFTDDAIPDVISLYVVGTWPQYQDVSTVLIDGANGDIVYLNDSKHFSFASPLAIDFNGDGRDESFIVRSGVAENSEGVSQRFNSGTILDSCTLIETELYNKTELSIGTPVIVDLDSDGYLELISTTTTFYGSNSEIWTVERYDLNSPAPDKITWGAYMGTNYDGIINI